VVRVPMQLLEEKREGEGREAGMMTEGRKDGNGNVIIWMVADGYGYHRLQQPEGGPRDVQALPEDEFTEEDFYCRALANSFAKTEV
ncbi:hypothetical protein P7K49_028794, partial [Saguinus oedipus]